MMKDFQGLGVDLSQVSANIDRQLTVHGFRRAIKGLDLHTITAALICGVRYDEVTAEQRRRGKTANFSVLYDPRARWKAPEESTLMGIYTEEMKVELAKELGVEVNGLYAAIVNKLEGK